MRKLILSAVSVLLCILLIAGFTGNEKPDSNKGNSSKPDTSSDIISSEEDVSAVEVSFEVTSGISACFCPQAVRKHKSSNSGMNTEWR